MEYNTSRYHDTQTTFHRLIQPLPPNLTSHIILTHLLWLVSPSMLPRHGLTQHCIIASHHTRTSSASPHGRTIDSHSCFLNLPPDTSITIHSGFHLLQLSNNPYTTTLYNSSRPHLPLFSCSRRNHSHTTNIRCSLLAPHSHRHWLYHDRI